MHIGAYACSLKVPIGIETMCSNMLCITFFKNKPTV